MPEGRGYRIIEDKDLVAAALSGGRDAFDELVRRYRGAVILVAWKILGCREGAQDAAQEAFVSAFEQLKSLKDGARFGPWLCTIAGNRARRIRTRECRSSPVEGEQMDRLLEIHEGDRVVSPVDAVLKQERDSAIHGLIAGLPAGIQMVVQLYYTEQWNVARIAEFLSLTQTTVRWRLHSGRKQISRKLIAFMSDENLQQGPGAKVKNVNGKVKAKNHGQDE